MRITQKYVKKIVKITKKKNCTRIVFSAILPSPSLSTNYFALRKIGGPDCDSGF